MGAAVFDFRCCKKHEEEGMEILMDQNPLESSGASPTSNQVLQQNGRNTSHKERKKCNPCSCWKKKEEDEHEEILVEELISEVNEKSALDPEEK